MLNVSTRNFPSIVIETQILIMMGSWKSLLPTCQSLLEPEVLPNWVYLPSTQQTKVWDAEICSREKIYSKGSQVRSWKSKSQTGLPQRRRCCSIYGIKLQGDLRKEEWWLEARKRWCNGCSVPVDLRYTSSWDARSEDGGVTPDPG